MSYDISVMVSEDGKKWKEAYEVGNMTYNVCPMYVKALDINGSFGDWIQSQPCLYLQSKIHKALVYMAENKEDLIKLNPSNGWGDYYGAYKYLGEIHSACLEHPTGKIRCD